jgi:hypothetical protein
VNRSTGSRILAYWHLPRPVIESTNSVCAKFAARLPFQSDRQRHGRALWGDLFGEETGSGGCGPRTHKCGRGPRGEGRMGGLFLQNEANRYQWRKTRHLRAAKTAHGVNIEDARQWPKRHVLHTNPA